MAAYGAGLINAARLDAAVRELDQVSLRRGRFAAAQLWKVTSINGRYFPLGDAVAPFLGDVDAVVPHHLLQIYRHLEAFRYPTRSQNGNIVQVLAWAEEVRGMPVDYYQVGSLRFRTGVMPRNATRNGYADVRIPVTANHLFDMAWMFKYNAEWPMISRNGGVEVHPALDRLVARTAAVNIVMRNHFIDRRQQEIARRGRQAARLGLRVDRNGGLLNIDDSSSED